MEVLSQIALRKHDDIDAAIKKSRLLSRAAVIHSVKVLHNRPTSALRKPQRGIGSDGQGPVWAVHADQSETV
ncbi:MAG: hypothetical protein ABJP66_01655 [Hyphomicrobiales bacterium]